MESGEIIHEKVYVSPRPPPKISFKDYWMKELDSEVGQSSKDSQRIQPKPKAQLSRTVRLVGEQPFTQEIEKDDLSEESFNKVSLDALSIPHYVIKKGRCHGARHGKTEEQKEYHVAWNAWKRCCKRVDSQGEHFKSIHDRFHRDQVYRESQTLIGWTEQKCIEIDGLAKQNHTYHLSTEEFKRYQGQWYLTLNTSGKNAPMRLRPDFRAAVPLKKTSSS